MILSRCLGLIFLGLFVISNAFASELSRCGFVFDQQKSQYLKDVNIREYQENLGFFSQLNYNQLVLTRPTAKSREALLAYMEALMSSVRGKKQSLTSKVLEKSDIKELVNLLGAALKKEKLQIDKLEDVLFRILTNVRDRKLGISISQKLFRIDPGERLFKDLFYLKLWTDPLYKVFEDFGVELNSYGPFRRGLGTGVRVAFSIGMNTFSLNHLGGVSLVSDGFSYFPRLRKEIIKPEEYYNLSLQEIHSRFQSEFGSSINKSRFSKVTTKLIHQSFVLLLSAHLVFTHLPVEAIYTSTTELQKQYVSLEIKTRELEGRSLFLSESRDIKMRLETMSKTELVENIRRLKLEIEQKSE